eukprot:12890092-Prorocentrum_lima.AAC.1
MMKATVTDKRRTRSRSTPPATLEATGPALTPHSRKGGLMPQPLAAHRPALTMTTTIKSPLQSPL